MSTIPVHNTLFNDTKAIQISWGCNIQTCPYEEMHSGSIKYCKGHYYAKPTIIHTV